MPLLGPRVAQEQLITSLIGLMGQIGSLYFLTRMHYEQSFVDIYCRLRMILVLDGEGTQSPHLPHLTAVLDFGVSLLTQ